MADFEKVYLVKFDTRKAQNAIKKLDKGLDKLSKASVDAGKRFDSAIGKKAVKSAQKLDRAVKKSRDNLRRLGKSFNDIGNKLSTRVTLPLAAAGLASLKFARDFNKNMARVATLIPGQTERVLELKKGIQDLAIETGVSTAELSDGMYAAISAWGDGVNTLDRLRVVAKAAQAGLATTEQTLNLLASLTEVYGDNTAEATEHLADLAFVANKLAIKAPFDEMAASLGKVAPLAKDLNISQEELFATMTAGAGVTGNVAEVATQMRGLYVQLMKETPLMEKVVSQANKKLGTSYSTVAEMMKKIGFMPMLQLLKDSTENSKEFQKVLGGRTEGLVLATALLGGRTEKYNEALKEMTTNSGQMVTAHKEITEGIDKEGYAWDRTKRKMMTLAQRLGDTMLPMVDKLIKDYLTPLLEYLEGLDKATLEWAVKLGALAAAAGPAMKILGGALKILGGIKGAILAIGGAASTLLGVFTAIGVAIYRFRDSMVAGAEELITRSVESAWRAVRALAKAFNWLADKIGLGFDTSWLDAKIADLKTRREGIDYKGAWESDYQRWHGKETPEAIAEANQKALEKTERNIAKYGKAGQLAENIDPSLAGGEQAEWATQTMMAGGKGGGLQQTIDARVNIKIDAPGGDPQTIERAVKKGLERQNDKLRRATQGLVVAEQ